MGAYVKGQDLLNGLNYVCKSNEKINSIGDAIGMAFNASMWRKSGGEYFKNNKISLHMKNGWMKDGKKMDFIDKVDAFMHNADGSYNKTAIAGSYLGLAGGMRLVSGGGLTRDGRGDHDIVGIPFI